MAELGRPLDKTNDIVKLQGFLAEMRNKISQAGYFHLGDLIYRMAKQSNRFDLEKDIRIWEDSDKIIGFVLYLACENNPEFQIRPEYYNSSLAQEMIQWTIDRAKELKQNNIEVGCLDIDKEKLKFLEKNGFQNLNDSFVCMEMILDQIPIYSIPDEYSFVTYNERPDLTSITGDDSPTDKNSEIFNSDKYRNDLGIRICFKDKEIVSGCICWYDEIDNCGIFEPVGTNEKHRSKGLAFATMSKALENLKQYGATRVYVHTHENNRPAIKLYEKLGFRITNYDHGFERIIE